MVQKQKRVFDLPKIMELLADRGVPTELSIIGGGPDEASLRQRSGALIVSGRVRFCGILNNEQVIQAFESADVLILTSEYEGLPGGAARGEGCGCVPVVTDIRSGIPDVVDDGTNGFRVCVGYIATFVDRLSRLQRDPELRLRLSRNAYAKISNGSYRIEDMTLRYARLFERVMEDARSGAFRRPPGDILPSLRPADEAARTWRNRATQKAGTVARRAVAWLRRGGKGR